MYPFESLNFMTLVNEEYLKAKAEKEEKERKEAEEAEKDGKDIMWSSFLRVFAI